MIQACMDGSIWFAQFALYGLRYTAAANAVKYSSLTNMFVAASTFIFCAVSPDAAA